MLVNRPGFFLTDCAAMHLGATCFSVYNTSSPEQIEYVVADAANRVIVTEPQFLDRVLEVRERVDTLEHVVVIGGEAPAGTISIEELEAMGDPGFDFEAAWRAVEPDDVLCLIYTSGTTGAAEGRAAHPRQHDQRLAGLRRGLRADAGGAQDLLPAERPRRRPLGLPLRADGLRRLRLLLPRPAPDDRLLDRGEADRAGPACRASSKN